MYVSMYFKIMSKVVKYTCWAMPGASPGFERRGPRIIFFSDLGICMSRSDMLRIARGVRGYAPREIFLKRCNLVRLRVYSDQILSLFFFTNYHFLYKK